MVAAPFKVRNCLIINYLYFNKRRLKPAATKIGFIGQPLKVASTSMGQRGLLKPYGHHVPFRHL